MAYKPPSQTVIDDELSQIPSSEAVFEALKLKQDALPTQTGNEGAFLTTNGSTLSWSNTAAEFNVTNYRLDPHTHDEGTETNDFTINWSNGAVHTVTLNAAGPLVITMSNPVNGGAYALRIIQGATPGTVTWPANVKWPSGSAPALSSASGDIDIVNFLYFDDGGGNTFYYATYALDFS